jgi:hypothetical protein
MFMNNRAAEELAQGRVHEAYWWLRGAHAQDPGFANLYNTLGVVYRHHGALAEAEQALQVWRWRWTPATSMCRQPGRRAAGGGRRRAAPSALAPPASRYGAPGAGRAGEAGPAAAAGRTGADAAQPGTAPPAGHHAGAWATRRRPGTPGTGAEFSATGPQRQLYAGKLEVAEGAAPPASCSSEGLQGQAAITCATAAVSFLP